MCRFQFDKARIHGLGYLLSVLLGLLYMVPSWAGDSNINGGDAVRVNVYNNPDLTTETRISDEGVLSFPLIGDIKIGGMSVANAEKKIANQLIREGFLREAQVNINVIESNGRQVAVLGEVRSPGKYAFSDSVKTVIDFLASARGRTVDASNQVHILKQGTGKGSHLIFNIDRMLKQGGLKIFSDKKFQLSAGDVIYVPKKEVFYIYGEVNRPGSYATVEEMSVAQALALGGGITPRGTEKGITIKRKKPNGKWVEIEVKPSSSVKTDDVIYVDESLF